MKLLPPLRVPTKKKTARSLPLDIDKHESRIQHYLDLANVALTAKKKIGPDSDRRTARRIVESTNRRA